MPDDLDAQNNPLHRDTFLAMVRKADRVVIEVENTLGAMDASYFPANVVFEALTEAPGDLDGLAGLVKPLKWDRDEAKGGGAKYNSYEFGREGLWNCVCYPHEDTQYRVAEGVPEAEAKAAAQADYEARILSALNIDALRTPAKGDVADAAQVILSDRFGGYGNRKAMQAMCDFIYTDRGRMPFPVSFYDGVFQAGLRAIIAQQEAEGGE